MPRTTMTFYLGTHETSWLPRAGVPLFISDRRLRRLKGDLPRAIAPWALDSGAFSEISEHGKWTFGPKEYVARVRRYKDDVGMLDWAAPQDWMCEPWILDKCGATVEEHQLKTIMSVITLRELAPDIHWIPVLQGWSIADYWRHAEAYHAAGLDLTKEATVGVGSVCRRQGTGSASAIVNTLAADGLRLHAFGAKTDGLAFYSDKVVSADSLAWSYDARRTDPLPGHTHKSCSNCIDYTLLWRQRLLLAIEAGYQARFPGEFPGECS